MLVATLLGRMSLTALLRCLLVYPAVAFDDGSHLRLLILDPWHAVSTRKCFRERWSHRQAHGVANPPNIASVAKVLGPSSQVHNPLSLVFGPWSLAPDVCADLCIRRPVDMYTPLRVRSLLGAHVYTCSSASHILRVPLWLRTTSSHMLG